MRLVRAVTDVDESATLLHGARPPPPLLAIVQHLPPSAGWVVNVVADDREQIDDPSLDVEQSVGRARNRDCGLSRSSIAETSAKLRDRGTGQ